MADRTHVGFRAGRNGITYAQKVAHRDFNGSFSAALRYLLTLGAKADMEAHRGNTRPDPSPRPGESVPSRGESSGTAVGSGELRERSEDVPRLPEPGPNLQLTQASAGTHPESAGDPDPTAA